MAFETTPHGETTTAVSPHTHQTSKTLRAEALAPYLFLLPSDLSVVRQLEERYVQLHSAVGETGLPQVSPH
jgi:hypothetical protein